jgi:hypothetical protein
MLLFLDVYSALIFFFHFMPLPYLISSIVNEISVSSQKNINLQEKIVETKKWNFLTLYKMSQPKKTDLVIGEVLVLGEDYYWFIWRGQRERSPHYQKLRARVIHIWDNRRGQPNRSAMEGPHPEGTTLVIMVTPTPGKYALKCCEFWTPPDPPPRMLVACCTASTRQLSGRCWNGLERRFAANGWLLRRRTK